MFHKDKYHSGLFSVYSNSSLLENRIRQDSQCPSEVTEWLGKIKLLYGVPLTYLVADEGMLPPESIRFFYLDPNWIQALADGAFSIGRMPAQEELTKSYQLDQASLPLVSEKSSGASVSLRAKYLGISPSLTEAPTITGFLLRSTIVTDYPGLGVDAYPKGGEPSGENPGTPLEILRLEQLGTHSGTLLCLIAGDACRIDIHEAPEALHYGIDRFEITSTGVKGNKKVYPFSKEAGSYRVTIDMNTPQTLDLSEEGLFRTAEDPRTVNMAALAKSIARSVQAKKTLDASEMGFEMIEGVGMVTFYNKTS